MKSILTAAVIVCFALYAHSQTTQDEMLSQIAREPVSLKYRPERNITVGTGYATARTDDGEDVVLAFRRVFDHGSGSASPHQISLHIWRPEGRAAGLNGKLVFKVTVDGFSREIPASLVASDGFANLPTTVVRSDGSVWSMKSAELQWHHDPSIDRHSDGSPITKDEIADMVRHPTRALFSNTLFEIVNKRPFRVVEDDLLSDDRFARKAKELRRSHHRSRDRSLNRRFIDPDRRPITNPPSPTLAPVPAQSSSPATPAEPPPPSKEDLITHYIEFVSGNVVRGRLISEKDADPVVFAIIVGGIEQQMSYPAKDIAHIGEAKK